jgi:hypothetical protein
MSLQLRIYMYVGCIHKRIRRYLHNSLYPVNVACICTYIRSRETREMGRELRISLFGIVTQFLRAFTTQLEEMEGYPEDGPHFGYNRSR